MRIRFLKAHEEFKPGKFACIPDDSALALIEAGKAKEALPYVPPVAKKAAPPAEEKVIPLPTAKKKKK